MTGDRDALAPTVEENTMEVRVSGNLATIKCQSFLYANAWSDPNTWGGDAPPRDGDTVVVPKGQVLLVDIASSPRLYAVFVEGSMIFQDGQDQQFYSNFILVRRGRLEAGTECRPRQSKLLLEFSGTILDKQLPIFGNKFLGCHQCNLQLNGRIIEKTWSRLESSANVGDTQVLLFDDVTTSW